jgi:hypothetical protein
MLGTLRLALPPGDRGYAMRVLRALDGRRIGTAALATLLLSLGALVSPTLIDFFSPAEIALAWLEHLAELAVLGAGLLLVYTLLDEALPRELPMRLVLLCGLLFITASGLALLLYAYYAHGFTHLPPLLRLLSDAMSWGLPAVFWRACSRARARLSSSWRCCRRRSNRTSCSTCWATSAGCTAPARRPAWMPSTA